jgi:fructuronate reductase
VRLGPDTLVHLPGDVGTCPYDRDAQKIGIVHFGIGAFHRAHQAWYTDCAMTAGDRDWGICGVSLRSPDVARQINPQGGLYTLTERQRDAAQTRVIGAVREVLYAPDQAGAVITRLADPACHIASFTVTEKGYARGQDGGLDLAAARSSFYPLLAQGLAQRRARGLGGLTLLSCDNLAENGRVLARLMERWLAAEMPEMVEWFRRECRVPSTMIDRIVPRSGPQDLAELEQRLGMSDAGAVFTERFSQWVIEDDFAGPRPQWENHGVELVDDVAPFETAKLRMLNGAHSLLAYCGLEAGYTYVHEAVANPRLAALAERLMRDEALPTITAAAGQDIAAYAGQLMQRFADPALMHRLDQIAMDGTQKIPQRWLDTAAELVRRGQSFDAIATGFAAWVWHLADGRFVDDPYGEELHTLAAEKGSPALVARCFGPCPKAAALWPRYEHLAATMLRQAQPS